MEIPYIEQLMKMMDMHHIDLLHLKEGEQEIVLERKSASAPPVWVPASPATPPPLSPVTMPVPSETAPAGLFVTSPMVGTFYSAASPDAPPFVTVGSKIEPQTVVCIIEAMKVMNEVKAGISGVVAEVLVKNGDPIEFGTKLFRVT